TGGSGALPESLDPVAGASSARPSDAGAARSAALSVGAPPASTPHLAPTSGATVVHSALHLVATAVSAPHPVWPQSSSKRTSFSNVAPASREMPTENPAFA